MAIIKNEILKNKIIPDMVKINLFKSMMAHLFIYDEFIRNTAKISQFMVW